jgi:hypothetical protein
MSPRQTHWLVGALFFGAAVAAGPAKNTWDFFRVYKVADGKRTMLQGDQAPGDEEWHALRMTMSGPKITCCFDGRKMLEAEDATFPEADMIGLWSKADAQSFSRSGHDRPLVEGRRAILFR